ncbi:PAS domain S-box protein [Pullulanibacillus sp. KACC 23026]|uniref:PAS domain S-box protein n=1 Tax=Pullulanibacillus sp. KACC 23026 TaxID=3028315 RepID=UPI0023AE899F|nr:PAS domain S-box protein [Pullulanibacillus sp. KACC 23026]WEG12079.1 PAS domain S-box protein [Pullulanibacillus sp. KACC 23026]
MGFTLPLEEKELFLNAFHHAPIGEAIVDLDGRFLKLNRALCDMLGYSEDEMLKLTFQELTYPDDLDRHLIYFRQALRRKMGDFYLEKRYIHKRGHIVWGSIRYSLVSNEADEPMFFKAQIRNVTEQKRVEQALEESYQQFRRLADQHPDPMLVTCKGKIMYINKAALHITGYSNILEEDVRRFVHPQDYQKLVGIEADAAATQKERKSADLRVLCKDGHYIEVEVSATEILYAGEQCVQSVLHDITHLKESEKKSAEMLRYPDRLYALGELAAGIAHEIRNPLASIQGFIQLFQKELIGHAYYPYLKVIADEVTRINDIVGEFLLLSKSDNSTFQPLSIQVILEQVIHFLTPQANLVSVEIIPKFETKDVTVLCNMVKLKQVFINLIKNSIEAMPSGGAVTIKMSFIKGFVKITVEDQGCGIPEPLLTKIGKPFFTTKETGTGLGIMVTKNIIEHHNGTILFRSREGIGTAVEIDLPIYID